MQLLGSRAWAIFALAKGTVRIERLGERNHHQTHHHRKRQRSNRHGAFQSFHRIGARIGLNKNPEAVRRTSTTVNRGFIDTSVHLFIKLDDASQSKWFKMGAYSSAHRLIIIQIS